MKICPECHKISKDDDFCSNCGAAVFSADDYSEDASCRDLSGHDHSKITYDRSERGTKLREDTRADAFFPMPPQQRQGGQTPPVYNTQFIDELRRRGDMPPNKDMKTFKIILILAVLISVIITTILAYSIVYREVMV